MSYLDTILPHLLDEEIQTYREITAILQRISNSKRNDQQTRNTAMEVLDATRKHIQQCFSERDQAKKDIRTRGNNHAQAIITTPKETVRERGMV